MNIYNYIEMNYIQEPEFEQLLPQELITEFLQRQAWKGLKEEELRNIWRDIYAYILANTQTNQVVFQNRNLDSVKNLVGWLNTYAVDFEVTPTSLRRFLGNVQMLHEYLLTTKYIMTEYINFNELYESFIGADGNVDTNSIGHKEDKVVHIDFADKTVKRKELRPDSIVMSKQPIYIREHIVDFSAKMFDSITHYKYTVISERLFAYYEMYWNRYVETKLADVAYDAEMLEQFSLTSSTNILSFAEYMAFGAIFTKDKGIFLEKVIKRNKSDGSFVRFLEHYRGAQLRFFKITGEYELGTCIKDVLSGDTLYLEDIDISHCEKNEVFTAYFNLQNNLLPSITISMEMNDMQIMAFQDSIRKMCSHMLGEQASINDFLENHDLLARYLWVVAAQNKRISLLLKTLIPTQVEHCAEYSSCLTDADLKKYMNETLDGLFVNAYEKNKFMQLWHDIYPLISAKKDFVEDFSRYLLAAIKVFLDINQPSEGLSIDDLDGFEQIEIINELRDINKSLDAYDREITEYLKLEDNKLRYMTELGMINFIDNLIDKG